MRMSDGAGRDRGGRGGGGGGGRRKTATATMLAAIPGGAPAVRLPFKGFSETDKPSAAVAAVAAAAAAELQSLIFGSRAPSESIGTVCVFRTAQTKKAFF